MKDVKMRRCEDAKMQRCEDKKMRRCEDVQMRRCENALGFKKQTPSIRRTLRPDALGKKQHNVSLWREHQGNAVPRACSCCKEQALVNLWQMEPDDMRVVSSMARKLRSRRVRGAKHREVGLHRQPAPEYTTGTMLWWASLPITPSTVRKTTIQSGATNRCNWFVGTAFLCLEPGGRLARQFWMQTSNATWTACTKMGWPACTIFTTLKIFTNFQFLANAARCSTWMFFAGKFEEDVFMTFDLKFIFVSRCLIPPILTGP